jgi:hypothetical protein
MAAVQAGLGGKTKAIVVAIVAAVIGIAVAMVLIPYPLKMDANGQLQPVDRLRIYAPHPGHVRQFLVEPNSRFKAGQSLAVLDDAELTSKISALNADIDNSDKLLRQLKKQLADSSKDEKAVHDVQLQIVREQAKFNAHVADKDELIRINNADKSTPGRFWIVAPPFSTKRAANHVPEWTVLDPDFREKFTNQYVKPSDPIMRLGDVNGPFEVELKIPEKHIGQVKRALSQSNDADPKLDVDLLVLSHTTQKFRGVLYKSRVAGEATANRDDHNESAPVVVAYVSLDDPSIPEDLRVPRDYITTGVEVHAKILCGNHKMGYSLFYGLWEFLYEKVVFFF